MWARVTSQAGAVWPRPASGLLLKICTLRAAVSPEVWWAPPSLLPLSPFICCSRDRGTILSPSSGSEMMLRACPSLWMAGLSQRAPLGVTQSRAFWKPLFFQSPAVSPEGARLHQDSPLLWETGRGSPMWVEPWWSPKSAPGLAGGVLKSSPRANKGASRLPVSLDQPVLSHHAAGPLGHGVTCLLSDGHAGQGLPDTALGGRDRGHRGNLEWGLGRGPCCTW